MELGKLFNSVWKDLTEQGKEALDTGDGALLLRVQGGRAVLMHIADACGYKTEVKENGQGKGTEPSPKPGRGKKKKEASRGS